MTITINISGLRELSDALKQLPVNVAKKRLAKPVAIAAALIRTQARAGAPVDTGTLRKAILIKRDRTSPEIARYIVTVRQGKSAQKVGKKQTNLDAYYWTFLEFGTAKMAARPFLRPAFESSKQEALRLIVDGIRAGVEAEAAELGAKAPKL